MQRAILSARRTNYMRGLASQEKISAKTERNEADTDCLRDRQWAPKRANAHMMGHPFVRHHLLTHGDLPGAEAG